jgi:hypothetical protein
MEVRKREFRKYSESYLIYGLTEIDDEPESLLLSGLFSNESTEYFKLNLRF